MLPRLAAALTAALFVAGLLPGAALAQAPADSLLRNQTRIVNQAVNARAREAARPPAAATALRAVNLRAEPTARSAVVAVVPAGAAVAVTGPSAAGWTPVSIDGRTGYIASALLSPKG